MHAVFVTSEIDPARADEAEAMLNNVVLPGVKQAPGFVSGTWGRSADRASGRSVAIFESEDAARATFEAVSKGIPDDGPVTIVSAEVMEVVAQI